MSGPRVSRRRFLAGAAVLGAGAALLGVVAHVGALLVAAQWWSRGLLAAARPKHLTPGLALDLTGERPGQHDGDVPLDVDAVARRIRRASGYVPRASRPVRLSSGRPGCPLPR